MLTACGNRNFKKSNEPNVDSSWSRITKNGLKLEFKRRNDTLFTNIIDLKGKKNGNFDVSHSRISTFDSIICKKIVGIPIQIFHDSLIFSFDTDSLKKVCKVKNCSYWFEEPSQRQVGDTDMERFPLFQILKEADVEIKELRTGKMIQFIAVENYKTHFEGGKIYSFVGYSKDTLYHTMLTEWMR